MAQTSPLGEQAKAPKVVHPLPVAPVFLGREAELDALRAFWRAGDGIASLVGLGGAGKTATLERFLREVIASGEADGVLVWSFYDDPDTNAFLKTAVEYFSGGGEVEAQGAGWFYALKQSLESGKRYLLVMDGLERVQRAITDAGGIFGELEDPLLRGLLVRLASGSGRSKAVITSRFPISDIDRWIDRGYKIIDINQLDEEAAIFVLRSHGAEGSREEFSSLLASYGRHALTTDLLGAVIAKFNEGCVGSVDLIDAAARDDAELQSMRLAAVLAMFQRRLSEQEIALLCRLCVFRFGVTLDSLIGIFVSQGSEGVSGSLQGATPELVTSLLDGLVDAHLVHREIGDKFTVHPAIRDHFYQIFRDSAAVHGAISQHLLSLSGRPGVGLPAGKDALDLLEELVYHALKAGNEEQAIEIYAYRMGGNEHLNTQLGEYTRTYRILKAFHSCPDPGAMYYCLRAFGRFEEALKWRKQNRYIRLANGRLSELASDPSDTTSRLAQFLRGENGRLPERAPDSPISPAYAFLLTGQIDDADRSASQELQLSMYHDDVVRSKLVLAELARIKGHADRANEQLDELSKWILGSGSHEHLCVMLLFRARLELAQGTPARALSSVEEGIQIAREAEFKLWECELLVVQGRCHEAMGKHDEAMMSFEEAMSLARQPSMRFVWGEIAALSAAAGILEKEGNTEQAAFQLRLLADLQNRVFDPRAKETEKRLGEMTRNL